MAPADFSILSIWIIFGILFLFLWTDKLYKFYLGLILGFLLYLVFNFKISLLEFANPDSFSAFETFFFWNRFVCSKKHQKRWNMKWMDIVFATIFKVTALFLGDASATEIADSFRSIVAR